MAQLTIEHLAPYLPYGLKYATLSDDNDEYYIDSKHNTIGVGGNQSNVTNICLVEYSRPIYRILLRPLSQLTQEIEHNGERFVPIVELASLFGIEGSVDGGIFGWDAPTGGDDFQDYYLIFKDNKLVQADEDGNIYGWMEYCSLEMFQKLFSWHFDVFGLLEQNLAIEIK